MSKTIFITYGVGGSEALNPLYLELRHRGEDVMNVSLTDFTAHRLADVVSVEPEGIFEFLDREKPALVVNERSNGLPIQNGITRHCRDNGIFNLCVLDMYGAYRERFRELPDLVIIPGRDILEDLLREGFPEDRFIIGGNPGFDELALKGYKRKFIPGGPCRTLYISQPRFEMGIEPSQFRVLDEFEKVFAAVGLEYDLRVRLHPNEKLASWSERPEKIEEHGDDALQHCLENDLVIGYDGTPLLKAFLAGIPSIFLDELENSESELEVIMRNFMKSGTVNQQHRYLDFETNATEKCLKIIENFL